MQSKQAEENARCLAPTEVWPTQSSGDPSPHRSLFRGGSGTSTTSPPIFFSGRLTTKPIHLHVVLVHVCAVLLFLWPALGWSFTSADLASELNNDPAGLGYSPLLLAGNDAALVAALNQVRAGAPYLVSKGTVSRDSFLGTWSDVIDNIRTISDTTIHDRWTWRVEKLLIPKETINYDDPQIAGFFAQMIADGLTGAGGALTTGDVDARTKRQGSRAEVLWGAGTVITLKDVSLALRNSQ